MNTQIEIGVGQAKARTDAVEQRAMRYAKAHRPMPGEYFAVVVHRGEFLTVGVGLTELRAMLDATGEETGFLDELARGREGKWTLVPQGEPDGNVTALHRKTITAEGGAVMAWLFR